jgi:hypothetical protein
MVTGMVTGRATATTGMAATDPRSAELTFIPAIRAGARLDDKARMSINRGYGGKHCRLNSPAASVAGTSVPARLPSRHAQCPAAEGRDPRARPDGMQPTSDSAPSLKQASGGKAREQRPPARQMATYIRGSRSGRSALLRRGTAGLWSPDERPPREGYGPRPQHEQEPPFGMPRTMTVRLVADIQNRLFWRVGTGRASECCVPLRDGASGGSGHPAGICDGGAGVGRQRLTAPRRKGLSGKTGANRANHRPPSRSRSAWV